jgi:hypothetical protein
VLAQSLKSILGAGGSKTAGRRGKRGYTDLVTFNQQDQGKDQYFFKVFERNVPEVSAFLLPVCCRVDFIRQI